jgi:type II secretory pathway pseudopilin PulG
MHRYFSLLELLIVLTITALASSTVIYVQQANSKAQLMQQSQRFEKYFQSIFRFVLLENCSLTVHLTTDTTATTAKVTVELDPLKEGALMLKEISSSTFPGLKIYQIENEENVEENLPFEEKSWELIFDPGRPEPFPECSFLLEPTPSGAFRYLHICSLAYTAKLHPDAAHNHELLLAPIQHLLEQD